VVKNPNNSHSAFGKDSGLEQEWRNSNVFRNWHGACNLSGIRRNGSSGWFEWKGNFEMSVLSQLPARFTAAVSAFALSLVLISGTVSMPSAAQAQTTGAYVGVVA
jgi:hypothetical protein